MFKKIFAKIGLALFGIFIALVFAEIAGRILGLSLDQADPPFYYKTNPASGYDISPNFPRFTHNIEGTPITYWSNNIGCFDTDYTTSSSYILLVGDSFTWGYAPFIDKWGTLMEQYTGTRVLKCGVSGYGTAQELVKAKEIVKAAKKNPSLIVLGYFEENDATDDYVIPGKTVIDGNLVVKDQIQNVPSGTIQTFSDKELNDQYSNYKEYCKTYTPRYPLIARFACFLKQHFVIYSFLKNGAQNVFEKIFGSKTYQNITANPAGDAEQWLTLTPTNTYPWLTGMWQNNLKNLAAFQTYANSVGSKLLVVLIPDKQMVYPADRDGLPNNIDLGLVSRTVENFLTNHSIVYVDMLPSSLAFTTQTSSASTKNINLYWRDDGHWNITGNHLAGLTISQFILKNNLVSLDSQSKSDKLQQIEDSFKSLH